MRGIFSFIINDLRNIKRDPLLTFIMLIPLLVALLLRWLVPMLNRLIFPGISISRYYPVIISYFVILLVPIVIGIIGGFTVLNEREGNVLMVIFVTPFSPLFYTVYRVLFLVTLSVVYTLTALQVIDLISIEFKSAVYIAIASGTIAPATAMFIATFTDTKTEVLALLKVLGIFFAAPLFSYFLTSKWQLVAGILPTYWPFKTYLVAAAGSANYMLYNIICILVNLLIISLMLRRFRYKIYQNKSMLKQNGV